MPEITHHFRAGAVVEVRSIAEIEATLDADGMLEGVPFMAEMREFCGRRFHVFKRADKICVERPHFLDLRRMKDAVFLDEVRCDGSAHDGCGRLCMIFWKEAWLKPTAAGALAEPPIDWVRVLKARETRTPAADQPIDESKTYRCQSTALYEATQHVRLSDVRAYLRDVRSGTFRIDEVVRILFRIAYCAVLGKLGYRDVGKVVGTATKTPAVALHLRPGDLVRVRRKEQVALTLDEQGKNRGLTFGDSEISRHCKLTFPVLARIDRMILEDTGKMRKINNTVLLQGTACSGLTFRGCARNSHPMWREAWLDREGPGPA